jgi:hypothetical protein
MQGMEASKKHARSGAQVTQQVVSLEVVWRRRGDFRNPISQYDEVKPFGGLFYEAAGAGRWTAAPHFEVVHPHAHESVS